MKINETLKDFALYDDNGLLRHLHEFKGKNTIIYFYPKDDTPGCTRQACSFRDNYNLYQELGINVIGISKDSIQSHEKFKSGQNLPFTLLSDPDLEVIKYFDVYKEKLNYGKPYMGVVRTTFVLDENFKVIKVYEKADPDNNAQEILEFIKGL